MDLRFTSFVSAFRVVEVPTLPICLGDQLTCTDATYVYESLSSQDSGCVSAVV